MKRLFTSFFVLFACLSASPQTWQEMYDQKVRIIDSLQRELNQAVASNANYTAQALDDIINAYKQPFDELVKSSSKQSVPRDLRLIGDNTFIRQTLTDLEKYFNAKELLSKKYDDFSIPIAQKELGQIKQNYSALEKLKLTIDNYQTFNDGLKETVAKRMDLDSREQTEEMPVDIQKLKFNKILAELSSYIFNYDFNFMDYPYLSDIVLEIIKRKQPNVDADISDLFNKL
ncbi:MAG: hypothetical protein LBD80_02945 [Tannerella sp.]|jgi:hypothetical protein|nr:hypothetical protein [Tannerella sp.]